MGDKFITCLFSLKIIPPNNNSRNRRRRYSILPASRETSEEVAVSWAVKGPSYRDARDRLEEILGHRILSHETIRQRVLKLAEKIQKEAWSELPTAKKQRKVIFIEVHGLNCHLQREKKSKTEVKIGVVHDGWEKRHPSSKEYNLVDKRYWCSQGDGETFGEEFSRLIYNIYEVNVSVK